MTGGLIGFGHWGRILAKTLKKTKPSLNLRVFDISKKAREEASRKGFFTVSSLKELLKEKDISFLMIATPPHSHLSLVNKGLKAEKHILVEKPFGFCNKSESFDQKAAFQMALKKKKVLMVDWTYKYSPGFRQMKKYLKNAQMQGYESLRLGSGFPRKDISVIEDLMVHDISMLLSLIPSKPLFLSCLSPEQRKSDSVQQQALAFIEGKNWKAYFQSSRVFPKKTRTVIIRTEKKVIQFEEENGKTLTSLFNKKTDSLKEKKETSKTSLEEMFNEFFKRIKKQEYSKDFEEYLRIASLLKALSLSLQQNGKKLRG